MNHHACGATWTGHIACHCASCHLTFADLSAFDRHRRVVECVPPASLTRRDGNPTLTIDRDGYWEMWRSQSDRERNAARVAALRTPKTTLPDPQTATNSPTPVPDSQPTPQRPSEAPTLQETR